jgi:hypothetical protein
MMVRRFAAAIAFVTLSISVNATAVNSQDPEQIVIAGRVVDHAGQAAAKAVVTIHNRYGDEPTTVEVVTDDSGKFQTQFAGLANLLAHLQIHATSEDGRRRGYYRFSWDTRAEAIPAAEIKLETTKVLKVRAVDAQGNSVAGAKAAMQLGYPVTLSPVLTGEDGFASFEVPESERVLSAVAWKDHMGLDYRVYSLPPGREADVHAKPPEFPENGFATLVLDGAAPLTVRVTDDQGHPLAGVDLYPWLLKKESESDELNLGIFPFEFKQPTDANGTVSFPWIPAWNKRVITVWPTVEGFVCSRGNYDPLKNSSGRLEMSLARLVPIRGRVTLPDGTPRAGIPVEARGQGYSSDGSSGNAVTDSDGRYELLVAPEQIYLVIVRDKDWVSTPRDGFAVHSNSPMEGQDFVLRPATRLSGRLLNEKTRQAIPGQTVLIYQYGQDLRSLQDVHIANPDGETTHICPTIVHAQATNELGEFHFSLGDGSFDIRPPDQSKAEKFQIAGEPERTLDVFVTVVEPVELSGLILNQSGHPLGNATVDSIARSFRHADWTAKTSDDGRFTVKRREETTVVHAVSSDKTLAGIVEIAGDQTSFEMKLDAVGSARGRLLAEDAKTPVGKTVIDFGVTIRDIKNQSFMYGFGGHIVTAEDGTFQLEQLVPGHEYGVYLDHRSDGTLPFLTKFTVTPGESVDLRDLAIPPPPKPYTPPTLEERISDAFSVKGTPTERMNLAKDFTDLVNQHLLIVFGVPSNDDVRKLMDLRYNDPEFGPFADEFRIMAIPTDMDRLSAAEELAASLGESLSGGRGNFLLIVCDRAGKKLASVESGVLSDGSELSKEKLFEFLRGFRTEPLDARQLLADALQKAAAEDKRVIIQETATWCGPCHKLARFLSKHRAWEKDFIWVKVDHRWTGAEELMSEIRAGAKGGIPWYAILDATGKVLATSNDPKSGDNIGFPSEPSGQLHFAHMLNSTRQRMTADEVKQLVDKLKEE